MAAIHFVLFYLVIQRSDSETSRVWRAHTHCLQVSEIKSNKFPFSDIIYGLTGCSPAFSYNKVSLESNYSSWCTNRQFYIDQLRLPSDIVIDPLQSGAVSSLWYERDLDYVSSYLPSWLLTLTEISRFTVWTHFVSLAWSSFPAAYWGQ